MLAGETRANEPLDLIRFEMALDEVGQKDPLADHEARESARRQEETEYQEAQSNRLDEFWVPQTANKISESVKAHTGQSTNKPVDRQK